MAEDDPDRVEGVDFTDVNLILEDPSYPITADEVIERHGDLELERTNADPISIQELFDYMGEDTFESEDQLRQMILGQMPATAKVERTTPTVAAPIRRSPKTRRRPRTPRPQTKKRVRPRTWTRSRRTEYDSSFRQIFATSCGLDEALGELVAEETVAEKVVTTNDGTVTYYRLDTNDAWG